VHSVIFYECATNDLWEVGFPEGPGGHAYDDRQAFAYHVRVTCHLNLHPSVR
jgi:hypothetical protein